MLLSCYRHYSLCLTDWLIDLYMPLEPVNITIHGVYCSFLFKLLEILTQQNSFFHFWHHHWKHHKRLIHSAGLGCRQHVKAEPLRKLVIRVVNFHANTIHSARYMEVLSLIYTVDFRGEEIKKYMSFQNLKKWWLVHEFVYAVCQCVLSCQLVVRKEGHKYFTCDDKHEYIYS